jgi:hypothetical protein
LNALSRTPFLHCQPLFPPHRLSLSLDSRNVQKGTKADCSKIRVSTNPESGGSLGESELVRLFAHERPSAVPDVRRQHSDGRLRLPSVNTADVCACAQAKYLGSTSWCIFSAIERRRACSSPGGTDHTVHRARLLCCQSTETWLSMLEGTMRLALKVKLFGTCARFKRVCCQLGGLGTRGGSRCVVVCIPIFRGVPSKLCIPTWSG